MVEKNAETSSMDFCIQLLLLKARNDLKIYGLIFGEKEKFDSERLILKLTIFQKSAMEFLIHLF